MPPLGWDCGTLDETLFSIACPTCERLLAVRSESAIGGNPACPKCGSMVHVIPPPGWKPKAKAVAAAPGISENSPPAAPARLKKKAAIDASAARENGQPAEDVSSSALETTPSESLTVPPPILARARCLRGGDGERLPRPMLWRGNGLQWWLCRLSA